MISPQNLPPILSTKLYRPPVTEDFVSRPLIEQTLNNVLAKPLTIVVAPAGYGKSTVVSAWDHQNPYKSAWLSLDDSDSDPRVFLTYFLAAVRTATPDFGNDIQGIVDAEVLPSPDVIAIYLSNELELLNQPLTLVLDDFHKIRHPDIHEMLDVLLAHPPSNFHLILSCRRDPAISLQALRARNQVAEIRMRDLIFSVEDTSALVNAANIGEIKKPAIRHLHERTEGWPAGIRLAMLASLRQDNPENYLRNFGSRNLHLQEYILQDLFGGLPDAIQECLLSTAVLEQFCAPLCDAVIAGEGETGLSGIEFVDFLRNSGLPIVSLDSDGRWYRYHHLFNDLLLQRLGETAERPRIIDIHRQAAAWLTENHLIEDAIRHSLAADDSETAVGLVEKFRHIRMADDEWSRLERWLSLFDPEVIEQSLPLTILECWLDLSHRYELADLFERLPKARQLLESVCMSAKEYAQVSLELDVLDCPLAYVSMDSTATARFADGAISDLPPDREYVRSIALMYRAGAHQIDGDIAGAEELIQRHITSREFQNPNSTARMLQALCFIYWADGDTEKLEATAKRLIDVSSEHSLWWSLSFGHYFAGVTRYDRGELDKAIEHLSAVVDRAHVFPIQNVAHCWYPLSLAHEANGDSESAEKFASGISQFCLERANPQFIATSQAFAAELAARQSNNSKARKWMDTYKPEPGMILHRFFHPEVAWLKIAASIADKELRPQIDDVAARLLDIMARSNHLRLKIDVLGIQALLASRNGDESTAADLIRGAIEIGQPGQLIRPLADLGPEIASILTRLELDEQGLEYVGQIIASMGSDTAGPAADKTRIHGLPDTLSDRESEILGLMAQGLRNKEIGEKLFISPGTVKRHAHNIYGKLAVRSRQEAVAKAKGLGILVSD